MDMASRLGCCFWFQRLFAQFFFSSLTGIVVNQRERTMNRYFHRSLEFEDDRRRFTVILLYGMLMGKDIWPYDLDIATWVISSHLDLALKMIFPQKAIIQTTMM